MKTRIIQTRFWDDEFIAEASKDTRYLYVYLLTCQYINISGIFQLSERKIQFETGLTPKEYENAMQELQKNEKAFFYSGWVYMVNARKNNNYENSPKNITACEKELERVPVEVKQHFDRCLDSSIDTTIDTSIDSSNDSTMHSRHKLKIINNKSKIKNQKEADSKIFEIRDFYNEVFGKNISSVRGFEKNFDYWREVHDLEKIKAAIVNARNDKFWHNKMTLAILFRQRNPNGESVDYIEDLANRDQSQQGNIAII